MKSFFFAVTLTAFLGSFAAHPARAESFLNHVAPGIFGAPEEGPKPEDTLVAPFGKDAPPAAATKGQSKLMEMYDPQKSAEDTSALDTPHRNDQQISEWVTNVATQTLTIDPRTFAAAQTTFGPLLTPYATKEYHDFLEKNKIVDMLKGSNMRLLAVVEGKPELVQAGALEGSYRWLYKVPLMLTYYEQATTTLKGTVKAQPQVRRMTLSIQVGRVPKKQLADEMIVERWIVTAG